MIRRWWRWRRELFRLHRVENGLWRAYAGAHQAYAEAADTFGYPAALPEAEDAKLAAEVYQEHRDRLAYHLTIGHWRGSR